jgi:hypothetical protein
MQDECAADFAPALGQVKDRSIANVLEAILLLQCAP